MSGTNGARSHIAERYRLERVIGRGGMGTVWQATDLLLDRPVAIKDLLLAPNASDDERHAARTRIMREAHAAARSTDPAVVTVHDVIDDGDRLYLVMEYVPARSLDAVVDDDGPLPPREVAELGVRIAGALSSAHDQGVIHRDVKPSNVLVPDGVESAKLVDFGIAAIADAPGVTTTGTALGSPSYMSPEQADGAHATSASDVFSLGSTLYFAVEGESPFQQPTSMATLAAVTAKPPRPPQRAGPLGPLLLEMLDKDPARRPPVSEVQDRLTALEGEHHAAPSDSEARGEPILDPRIRVAADDTRVVDSLQDRPEPASERAEASHRRWWIAAGVGLLVAIVAVAGLVVLGRGGDEAARGFVDYGDPQGGFQMRIPDDATVTLDEESRLTEVASGDARIAVQWVDARDGQVELMRQQQHALAALPGYEEITVEEQRFGDFHGMVGEFEFALDENPDEPLRSTGRTFAVGEFTFGLFFRAPADQFDTLEEDVFSEVESSFHPTVE